MTVRLVSITLNAQFFERQKFVEYRCSRSRLCQQPWVAEGCHRQSTTGRSRYTAALIATSRPLAGISHSAAQVRSLRRRHNRNR